MKRLVLAFALLVYANAAIAGTVTLKVKYVSSSSVYLEGGTNTGIKIGDQGEILRGDSSLGHLIVVYLSEKSASCSLMVGSAPPMAGDVVRFEVTTPETETPTTIEHLQAKEVVAEQNTPGRSPKPKFRGRAVLSWYSQDDLTDFDYDFSQPSLSLQSSYEGIAGDNSILNLRLRMRSIDRTRGSGTKWENRFYQLAVKKEFSERSITLTGGRFTFAESPGVGYIDGIAVERLTGEKWSSGGLIGLEPETAGEFFSTDRLKIGLFGRYRLGDWTTERRVQTTVAANGVYYKGELEREFLYIANDLTILKGLELYQTAEVELNRGWRKDLSGQLFSMSNFYAALRWRISRTVDLTVGYDDRLPYRNFEDRDLPDSLFDANSRRGIRGGVAFRLPLGFRTGVDLGSNGAGGGKGSTNGTLYLGSQNLLASGVSGNLRLSGYRSDGSSGEQISLNLRREVWRTASMHIDLGRQQQKWEAGVAGEGKSNRAKLGLDLGVGRRGYLMTAYEIQRGDFGKANRIAIDLGVRF